MQAAGKKRAEWVLAMPHGKSVITSLRVEEHYLCEMNQGKAVFGPALSWTDVSPVLARLGLGENDGVRDLDARVISTGLPYLILPVRPEALARAAIRGKDLESVLEAFGAKFILLFDIEGLEIRTWDNLGQMEDSATGSAAGPAGAYLVHHGRLSPEQTVILAQGRFAGRPSQLTVVQDPEGTLRVSGEVWPVSHGVLDMDSGKLWAETERIRC